MKTYVNYLYYRCYDFLLIFKSYDIYFAGLNLLATITGLSLLVIALKTGVLPKSWLIEHIYVSILFYLLPLSAFYVMIFHGRRYLKIIDRFEHEGVVRKYVLRGCVALYILTMFYFILVT